MSTETEDLEKLQLRIHGMDCVEEVTLLKRELLPLVHRDERLGFDLLNGKLTVDVSGLEIPSSEILAAIKRSGLKACLLYTSPSPRDLSTSRMPSSA